MASTAHEDAMQRLEARLVEQDRCGARYSAARGTSSEMCEYARLRAASARVAAADTSLHSIDDERPASEAPRS
jgi:hypothetical protein